MKKIDIITSGNLNVKTGLNSVIDSLKLGEKIFNNEDIAINKIVGFNKSTDIIERGTLKIFLKNIIKNILEKMSKMSKNITFLLIYLKYIYRAKKTVKKYLNLQTDSDVLIFHDIFACFEYLKMVEKINKKIILVLHTNGETFKQIEIYHSNQSIKTKNYLKKLEIEVLKKVHKIIFVSKSSLDIFNKNNPEYINKTTYIYNGIEDLKEEKKEIDFTNKPLNFICVGTLNGRKGQELILKFVNKRKKEIEGKIVFYIVGEGPSYEEYKTSVKRLNLENIIKVLGNRNDVTCLLNNSHIFILPSFDEGLPVAIIEAMRASLPIISTKVGGIPEMVEDNKEGFLINPDEKEIEKIILEILNNRVNLKQLSELSRKKYEKYFTLEVMIKRYAEVINE